MENIKLLKAGCQETDEDVCGNHEHFPASHSICQNKWTENSDQTCRSTLSFFLWFLKSQNKMSSLIAIFFWYSCILLTLMQKHLIIKFSIIFITDFLLPTSSVIHKLPCSANVQSLCLTVIQTFVSSEHLRRCTQLATPKPVIKVVFLINLWPSCTKI